MNDIKINIIDEVPFRLVYSFYVRDDINSIWDDRSYKLHLECMKYIGQYIYQTFDEIIFVISSINQISNAVSELKYELSNIFNGAKSIEFIYEQDNKIGREGYIFKKYILEKLDEYDGLTLFFHNKRMTPTYVDASIKKIEEEITYWIVGQYFFNMFYAKAELGGFIKNESKLIFGWPYMHDNYHTQWLIGGNCFWMKCQEISKYIKENNIENSPITLRCASEFYFPEIFECDVVDYPCSQIIKDYIYTAPYEPGINDLFYKYLQEVTPYNLFMNFMNFYNDIMAKVND